MHIDARKIDNNSIIEGDICIVGAGTAGISMALDWNNTTARVILLEGGGFKYDSKIQSLNKGKTTGQKYYPLESSRLRFFGGTTGHWAGMCSPLDDIDFEKRDYVPNSGWPITKKDLDPFYAKANETLQLGPYEYGFEYWKDQLPNLNPFPFDNSIVWNKMWQYSQARYGGLYKEDIVNSNNIALYTYANVTDILTNENVSKVEGLTIKNYDGKTHTVKAKHYVLACGAIQNTRLLLASNSQAKNGLGNDNDLVGRYFMEHLEIASAELWLIKPFPTDLYTWKFGETKASAELAITAEAQREHKILNGTAALKVLAVSRKQKPRIELWQDDDPRKAMEAMIDNWMAARANPENQNKGIISRAFQLDTRIEQSPNANSRVTLGQEKDILGVPYANLHWELTELDKRSIRKIYHLIAEQFGISGVGRLQFKEYLRDETDDSTWPEDTNAGWHHMGTCRMHDDPKQGVVDKNCTVHGVDNLHVAGSACFTTSGAPNPTLTLMALALRLSDHLKNQLS